VGQVGVQNQLDQNMVVPREQSPDEEGPGALGGVEVGGQFKRSSRPDGQGKDHRPREDEVPFKVFR